MIRILSLLVLLTALASRAQDSTAVERQVELVMDSIRSALSWRTGVVELPGGKARLDLPPGYRYLGPEDARFVLEDLWGNPDGEGTLGMIFAPDEDPLGDSSWGVIVQYEDDGHVDDADAADIDYGELLESMKQSTEEDNAARAEADLLPVHLDGWAEPPHYDAVGKKIYWAKSLTFEEHPEAKTLNYYVRILGREGVLELNAVSDLQLLPKVREGMARLNEVASFTEGNRYADYQPGSDRLSQLGIAALVGGGVAAAGKAGLFKGLLVGILAFKKLILVGLVGVGVGAKAWWERRRKTKEEREARFGGSDFGG